MKATPIHNDLLHIMEDSINITHRFTQSYVPGDQIIPFGQAETPLFFLIEGTVKIYLYHENGTRSIIHFAQAGDILGELSLLGVEEQSKEVIAQSNCTCIVVPRDKHEQLLLNLAFTRALNVYLAQKLTDRTFRLTHALNYPMINRLAAFILFAENDGIYHESATEIAEYLSTSYRHLMHTFKQLRELKLLSKIGTSYKITDRRRLEAYALDIQY